MQRTTNQNNSFYGMNLPGQIVGPVQNTLTRQPAIYFGQDVSTREIESSPLRFSNRIMSSSLGQVTNSRAPPPLPSLGQVTNSRAPPPPSLGQVKNLRGQRALSNTQAELRELRVLYCQMNEDYAELEIKKREIEKEKDELQVTNRNIRNNRDNALRASDRLRQQRDSLRQQRDIFQATIRTLEQEQVESLERENRNDETTSNDDRIMVNMSEFQYKSDSEDSNTIGKDSNIIPEDKVDKQLRILALFKMYLRTKLRDNINYTNLVLNRSSFSDLINEGKIDNLLALGLKISSENKIHIDDVITVINIFLDSE
jgi:hypothetical protein